MNETDRGGSIEVEDLGRMPYRAAYGLQVATHERVMAWRDAAREGQSAPVGVVLLVEHDPVITVSRRPGAAGHVLAGAEALRSAGVDVEETDRGGDVTYHGPGQLVAYPILDLNRLGVRLHEYMRLLEDAVIETIAAFGVQGARDAEATGVWVGNGAPSRKIAAMGVRVRRWVTMHGLALNVSPDMEHFGLIVPCGLHGRGVTSLAEEVKPGQHPAPEMDAVKAVLVDRLTARVARRA